MCGIVGIVGSHSKFPGIYKKLKAMTSVIEHRGPDDEGFHIGEDVSLGFKRLSIIDLTSGNQPIYNEDKSCVIVFNGEIYNYRELKKKLVSKGHQFYTNTDTETIIHLYEDFGEQCLQYLNGMFAFCIWDKKKQTAFLARDRLGIKPLYYSFIEGTLVFGSEIKSILKSGLVKPHLSYESLNKYLTYRFFPGPQTPFGQIHKLTPGHTLTYSDNKIVTKQYWRIRDFSKLSYSRDYLKAKLLENLKLAVKRRLISDVPLGLFLSGGIDSSAILALMSELTSDPVKTFCIGFSFGDGYQEFEYANKVAKLFGTDHKTMLISSHDFLNEIPRVVWYLDEPVADSATIPLYLIAKYAKKYVTVALSGEGSDEIFAGYSRLYLYDFKRHKIKKLLRLLPEFTRGHWMTSVFTKLLPRYLEKFNFVKQPIDMDKITSMGDYFKTKHKQKLLKRDVLQSISEKDSYNVTYNFLKDYHNIDYLDRKLLIDLCFWLPDNLLTKADRATMASGVELRLPFLDHELVEFSFRVKDKFKINRKEGKYILKKAFEDILPREVIYRPKMGFPVPLSEWFRGELREAVYNILLGERLLKRGIFKYNGIKELLDLHVTNKMNLSGHIWILLIFEIWCRIYIDEEKYTDIKLR